MRKLTSAQASSADRDHCNASGGRTVWIDQTARAQDLTFLLRSRVEVKFS